MGNWSWDPVNIRWFEDGVLNVASNCLDRHPRDRDRAIIWEADDPKTAPRKITYRRADRRDLPHGQCAGRAGRRKGRPGDDLHADDPRSGDGDAGLRAHRRGAFGGVRRLFGRSHCRAAARCAEPLRHHRRRRPARRQDRAAEGDDGQGAGARRGNRLPGRGGARHPPHRRRGADARGARPLVARAAAASCR